jgi:3-hydroxy-9,10-secoandrosta-1,3,5(10)-triene-9,17-dione monooxygenase
MTLSSTQTLKRSEPEVTSAELAERARALIPMLKKQAAEAEDLRRIPQHTFEALLESGLFRFNQPKRWGGYELPPQAQFAVVSTLARGCASTAWVVSNLGGHNGALAAWSEEAQHDVWGKSTDVLVASSFIFTSASAEAVPGGFKLSGRWPFSSGIDVSGWTIVGANTKSAEGEERRFFLIPREDYEIVDNWHVVGLSGTGSNELKATDIFVPAHRSLRVLDIERCSGPGLVVNSNPIYKIPNYDIGPFKLMGVVYGATMGAYDEFTEMLRVRVGQVSGQGLANLLTMQLKVSEAAARLQATELLVNYHQNLVLEDVRAGRPLQEEKLLACRRDAAYTARLCVEAVDIIMAATGGNGLMTAKPIQRFWRDVHAGSAQFGLNWDAAAPAFGRKTLGLPSGLPSFSGK